MLEGGLKRWLFAVSLILTVSNWQGFISSDESQSLNLFFAEAQEKPFFTTPQYSKNITHRTVVCDRFKLYANGTKEIRYLLEGLPLSVGVLDQKNDIFFRLNRSIGDENNTKDFFIREDDPGVVSHILDELARRGKFTWRNSYALVIPPNTTNNETWTDVLLDSVQRYDFSMAEWVHNDERRKLGISFPGGWIDASTILVQNQVAKVSEFEMDAFLKPFSAEVWYLICAVIFFSGIIYWIIDSIEYPNDKVNTVVYDTFLTTLTFTQHHQYWDPSTHGKRIFGYSAAFWALILSSAYTANQASFLVAQQKPVILANSLEEVSAKKMTLCLRAEAAVHNQIKGSAFGNSINFRPDEVFAQVYKDLREGKCDMMAARSADFDAFRNQEHMNPDCSLEWVGRAQFLNPAGAGTLVDTSEYCTSVIRHVLDIHMTEMQSDGTIERLWNDHLRSLENYTQCQSSTLYDTQTLDGQYALTVTDVGGIFVFHGVLIGIAILATLVESPWRRKRHRKKAARLAAAEESERGGEDFADYSAQFVRPSMERLHSNRSMRNLVGAEMSTFYQTYSDKDDSFSTKSVQSKIKDSIDREETFHLPAEGLLQSLQMMQETVDKLQRRAEASKMVDTTTTNQRTSNGMNRLSVIEDTEEANLEDEVKIGSM